MADSLFDILQKKDFDEPPESVAIRHYVKENFGEIVEVVIRERDILVRVPSAALATTLRYRVQELRRIAGTRKRLIFQIS